MNSISNKIQLRRVCTLLTATAKLAMMASMKQWKIMSLRQIKFCRVYHEILATWCSGQSDWSTNRRVGMYLLVSPCFFFFFFFFFSSSFTLSPSEKNQAISLI